MNKKGKDHWRFLSLLHPSSFILHPFYSSTWLPSPPMLRLVSLLVVVSWCLGASTVAGADPTYWQDVRPVLRKHCTVCHNQRNLKEADVSGGIALDSYEAALKSPKKTFVQSGKSDLSLLIQVTLN